MVSVIILYIQWCLIICLYIQSCVFLPALSIGNLCLLLILHETIIKIKISTASYHNYLFFLLGYRRVLLAAKPQPQKYTQKPLPPHRKAEGNRVHRFELRAGDIAAEMAEQKGVSGGRSPSDHGTSGQCSALPAQKTDVPQRHNSEQHNLL